MDRLGFPPPPPPGAPGEKPPRRRPARCMHRWRAGWYMGDSLAWTSLIVAAGRQCLGCGVWQERHGTKWVTVPRPPNVPAVR